MGQADGNRISTLFVALALALNLSCQVDEPLLPTGNTGGSDVSTPPPGTSTGGSSPPTGSNNPQLSAPIIADPLAGSTLTETRPTLTVLNSARTGGSPPTYLFQVSTESSFTSLVAQSPLVPEGSGGNTVWRVERALSAGRHFWRVRAHSGTVESNFSATADFTVNSSTTTPPPPPPSSGAILSDPLSGGSIGEVGGGRFTANGWMVTSAADYIRYEVPTLSEGWVEFDTTGLNPINRDVNQHMLFGMWDPSAGNYRANRFRVHIQKLHPPHNPPYMRLRWIANGQQHDVGNDFMGWVPNRRYRWRIEWGPAGGAHEARVLLDGQEMMSVTYTRPYAPDVHYIELGIEERAESVVGVTYSNFRVGR
jgi:hypothetical protein